MQELRRAQPNISLAWIANQMPIKSDADREHYPRSRLLLSRLRYVRMDFREQQAYAIYWGIVITCYST